MLFDPVFLKASFRGLGKQDPVSNTVLLVIIIAIVGVIILGNMASKNRKANPGGKKRYSRFVARRTATNIGLSPGHIKLMERLVRQLNVPHPVLLYSNRRMLDSFLKNSIYLIEKQTDKTAAEKAQYIKYIYEIKEKIDLHSRKTLGLKSSHLIKPDQTFMLITEEGEKFRSTVVNNLSSALICSAPSGQSVKLKRGMKVKVYFWRENDSGYSFVTRVAGFDERGPHSHFYLRHSTRLVKEQQRKFHRRPIQISCFLYPVEISGVTKRKQKRSIKVMYDIRFMGVMKDISARGCRVITKHAFTNDQLLKLEFSINRGENISAYGRVRGANIIRGQGTSLSIAFRKISNKARNQIYAYIFSYVG